MALGTGVEIHLAGNACETPEVLVFEIGAVAPAHHLHGDEVGAPGGDVRGEVKLGCHFGVFAVAHKAAVHPHAEVGCGRTHVQVDLFSLPVGRYFNGTAVGAGVVVLLLNDRRVGRELGSPGVADVLIDGIAVAVQLEESGHGEEFPVRIVEVGLEEDFGGIVVVVGEVEFPLAFEREVTLRGGLVALGGKGRRFEGEEIGTYWHGAYTVLLRVEPIRCRLLLGFLGAAHHHGGNSKDEEQFTFHGTNYRLGS